MRGHRAITHAGRRKRAAGALALAGAALIATGLRSQAEVAVPQPDILMITVCSLRADHVHAYGYAASTTPAIDALAATGTRYAWAYAAGAYTSAAHAALLTGRPPADNGVIDFGTTLAPNVPTLPEILKVYGYRTAVFMAASGPATLGYDDGLRRGFDRFETGLADDAAIAAALAAWWSASPHPVFALVHLRDAHQPYGTAPPGTDPRITDWQTQAFTSGSARAAESRHALMAGLAGEPALREALAGVYDDGVRRADEGVAQVMRALDGDGAGAEAVVLTGDHGEALGEEGHVGHKRNLDDAVIHVPLIVRYPAGTAEPAVVATEVSHLDVLPTLLALAGAAPPARLAGRSLLGLGDAAPWSPGAADPRVRPALAQTVEGAPGQSGPTVTVLATRGYRLIDRSGARTLYRLDGGGWRTDDTAEVRAALTARLTTVTPGDAAPATPMDPATVESLRAHGYW